MKKNVLSAALLAGTATIALAGSARADDAVTMNGITLYGTIDIGVAYQTHGAPLSSSFYPGLDYMVQKASGKSLWTIAPNGLSQSFIGIRGTEALTDEFSAIFRAETGFEPQSGTISDSTKSLIQNAGVTPANQSANADGSRTGQIFNGQAFVGISSKHFGTVTFGRNNSVLLDNINSYDPMGGSYAFSIVGFSGVTAGAGDTQDTRLDDSVKYTLTSGMFHGAAIYQFAGVGNNSPGAYEFDIGADIQGLAFDGVYSHVKDAISLAAVSPTAATYVSAAPLSATVSDNTAWTLNGKYTYGPAKLFVGYEHIEYRNPSYPLTASATNPVTDIGGYEISTVNNTAYTIPKILQVYWTGLKWSINSNLDLTGAWYHYQQSSYKGNGCTDSSFSSCAGQENVYSFVADYRLSSRFDVYAGVSESSVANGLANGFTLATKTADPMVGGRFKF